MDYTRHFSVNRTAQSMAIPGQEHKMAKNNAGGFVFQITKWDRLLRFLILGSEGNTYYSTEQKMTVDNAQNVVACINEDGVKVVNTIMDVSISGRAAKQNPTLFALALCCTFGNDITKKAAYDVIHKVCRTGTMLFTFVGNIKSLRGWSRGLRNGVAKFYTEKDTHKLELQLLKYRQRNGYTHKDVLRLSHPKTNETYRNELLKYAVEKECYLNQMPLLQAYEMAKKLSPQSHADKKTLINMIEKTGLPREGIPTEFLNTPEIWESLLEKMPIGAMVRNLGKMSSLNLTNSNLSKATIKIVTSLRNPDMIKRSRIHPMNILMALKTYQSGSGFRGSLKWKPTPKIIDALNEAFYLSFGNIEPTNKRIMIALDVSGSMTAPIMNSNIDCRVASAAMAMVTMRTEEWHDIIGFTSGGSDYMKYSGNGYGFWSHGVSRLNISPNQRLDDIVKYISGMDFGGTDCSLPMIYAEKNKIPCDAFIVYTDNETWAGNMHPKQALDSYRQKMGIPAKLIVVGMVSTGFSIADPDDAGMVDVIGMDVSTPNIISSFIRGFDA